VKGFIIALQFLTCLPTPAIVETCAQALAECLNLLQQRLAGDRHAVA